jgi:hypothetical protein
MSKCKQRIIYNHYFIKNAWHVMLYKIFKHKRNLTRFLGKKGISKEYSSNALINAIKNNKPFCAIRFGAVELSCWNNYRKIELGYKNKYKNKVLYSIKNNAGVFPTTKDELDHYSSFMLSLLKEVDCLAISGIHMEDYFAKYYMNNPIIIQNWACEPLIGNYTPYLKNKKVLVISPFSHDIEEQYKRRELLFKGHPEILPNFSLLTIEAPLTQGTEEVKNYYDYFTCLDIMKEKMSHLDFDILLVGAGAYGSPLAIFAKQMGKVAIQSGGATQTLFGIIGKRWENRDHVSRYINEYWIHPSNAPIDKDNIENGAYW